jgi:hypothetical protein
MQEDLEAVGEIALPPPAVVSSRKYQRQLANFQVLRTGDDVGTPWRAVCGSRWARSRTGREVRRYGVPGS